MLLKSLQHSIKLPSKVLLYGGTGQAIVNRPIIEYYGSKIIAIFDDTPGLKSPFNDIIIYHGWGEFLKWKETQQNPNDIGFCIAIGNPHGNVRIKLHDKLVKEGFCSIPVIHPTAFIDKNVMLGEGIQVMAGAIIQPEVIIGKQCIINTKASVDHECILEDGVEINPGATLCGNIHVGTNGWICAGATVLPRIKIGNNSVVGAGSLVTKNVDDNKLVYGVPAKEIREL